MKLQADKLNQKAWTLGVAAALMTVSGYYGEVVLAGDLKPRWVRWSVSVIFFLYIVVELVRGWSVDLPDQEGQERP